MTIHRGDIGHIKVHWDNHSKCTNCSCCSRESTCSTCSSWSNSVWILAESRILAARKKAMTARKKSQDPSISSEERKNNMGALPHMAVLAGERPILVATPRVLVPKGVQVHRATVTGLPTTDRRPIAHGEDTSDRPGMPSHRKPGMPGHRAPATGRSPSTGQCPVTGNQACPVTGHQPPDVHRANGRERDFQPTNHGQQPSSLRSLELDRLNSREIHRPPSMPGHHATGHRTAEYKSEYC